MSTEIIVKKELTVDEKMRTSFKLNSLWQKSAPNIPQNIELFANAKWSIVRRLQ